MSEEEDGASGSCEGNPVPSQVVATAAKSMDADGPLVKPAHRLPKVATAGRSWGGTKDPIHCSGGEFMICQEIGMVNCVSAQTGGKCHNRACFFHMKKCSVCQVGPFLCKQH